MTDSTSTSRRKELERIAELVGQGAFGRQDAPLGLLEDRARLARREKPVQAGILSWDDGNQIPEPEFLHQPGVSWRSRMVEEQWQVNSGHPDYRAVAERPALKLRYLANLFAKEVVLKSHQDPRFAEPLEQLVEIAAYADLYLTQTRRRERT